MSKGKERDDFNDDYVVTSNWIKFSVPQEDKVFGTLIAKRQVKSQLPGKEGEMAMVYDIKADYGSFHNLDDKKKVIDEPVEVGENSYWSVGGKPMIDRQMTNVKIGQKVGFKFIEEVASKTKGFAASKVIKIFTPPNPNTGENPWMDSEWLEGASAPSDNY